MVRLDTSSPEKCTLTLTRQPCVLDWLAHAQAILQQQQQQQQAAAAAAAALQQQQQRAGAAAAPPAVGGAMPGMAAAAAPAVMRMGLRLEPAREVDLPVEIAADRIELRKPENIEAGQQDAARAPRRHHCPLIAPETFWRFP